MTSTRGLMYQLLLALLPAAVVMTWWFGFGIVLNIVIAGAAAILSEFVVLKIQGKPLNTLLDGSAIVTAALLALALPPMLPGWMIILGIGFAILLAKHAYGGLGHNIFNPAMVGYAVLIISFPLAMSQWPNPGHHLPLSELLPVKAGMAAVDGFTMATPLDQFKFRTTGEYWTQTMQQNQYPWMMINAAFLLSGCYLLVRKICRWHGPVAMLGTLALLSLLFYDNGSAQSLGSPLLHLFSGATMMGAFFIVTDPVTSPETVRGQWLFGIGVGIFTFLIRTTGAYPEGLAFAVLLMNGATPFINYLEYRW